MHHNVIVGGEKIFNILRYVLSLGKNRTRNIFCQWRFICQYLPSVISDVISIYSYFPGYHYKWCFLSVSVNVCYCVSLFSDSWIFTPVSSGWSWDEPQIIYTHTHTGFYLMNSGTHEMLHNIQKNNVHGDTHILHLTWNYSARQPWYFPTTLIYPCCCTKRTTLPPASGPN